MKLKHLEGHLSRLTSFKKPKVVLEQYATPTHIAAHMLHHVESEYNDIAGKFVADLGCGAGVLSVGAAVLSASAVYGFEIDSDALEVYKSNVEENEFNSIEGIQCDVLKTIPERFYCQFDTVIMNPPFGTKNNTGIDMKFLEMALKLTNCVVYSLHKTSTRNYVVKYAEKLGAAVEVLAELRYDLPSTFKFHKHNSVDIEVDLIKFDIGSIDCNK